jgi:hypothetical protein
MKQTNFTIDQGTSFRFSVRMRMRDVDNNLVTMPLTDAVVRLQARKNVWSEDVLLDLSSENTNITVDEAGGTFTVYMTAAETRDLSWGKPHQVASALYHCEVELPDDTFRVLTGTMELSPEIVR